MEELATGKQYDRLFDNENSTNIIADMPYKHMEKYLRDVYILGINGIGVEPRKRNIFYDETEGFTTIDVGMLDSIGDPDSVEEVSDQNISPTANAIIVNLFRDYFATEEQKVKIKEILDLNQKKEEQEKYDSDNLFKKQNKEITKNVTNTALTEYKESFFAKFKNFIFRMLHISK